MRTGGGSDENGKKNTTWPRRQESARKETRRKDYLIDIREGVFKSYPPASYFLLLYVDFDWLDMFSESEAPVHRNHLVLSWK